MTAGIFNFDIEKGIQFKNTLTINIDGQPYDLTNYTAKLQIRETIKSSAALLTLTDGDGLTLGDDAGTIEIVISPDDTNAFTVNEVVYDLRLTDGDGVNVLSLIEGRIAIKPRVTRGS